MFKCDIYVNAINFGEYFLPRVPVIGDTLVIDTPNGYEDCKVIKVKIFCAPLSNSTVAKIYCEL
jgi:hypothetical protein